MSDFLISTLIAGRCLNTKPKIVEEFGKSINDATDLVVFLIMLIMVSRIESD